MGPNEKKVSISEKITQYWDKPFPITLGRETGLVGRDSAHGYALVGLSTRGGEDYVQLFEPNNMPKNVYLGGLKDKNGKILPPNMLFIPGASIVEGKPSTFELPLSKVDSIFNGMTVGLYGWESQTLETSNCTDIIPGEALAIGDVFPFMLSKETDLVMVLHRPATAGKRIRPPKNAKDNDPRYKVTMELISKCQKTGVSCTKTGRLWDRKLSPGYYTMILIVKSRGNPY